jgi:uncharacterized membrane protein
MVARTIFRNVYNELKPVIFVGMFVLRCVFALNIWFCNRMVNGVEITVAGQGLRKRIACC